MLQTQVRVENPDAVVAGRAEPLGPRARGARRVDLPRPRRPARGAHRRAPTCCSTARPIRLRGASLPRGRLRPRRRRCARSTRTASISQLKAIDANATRSQHPLDPGLLERLDAAGIMVWQGIGPTDAPGAWTSRRRRARAHGQGARAHERAPGPAAPVDHHVEPRQRGRRQAATTAARSRYIDEMAAELQAQDPSRPVALDIWGAHPPKAPTLIYRNIDMIGWTNYIGWYESTNAERRASCATRSARASPQLRNVFPDKVIAVTEFGAEANGRNATTEPGGYAFQAHLLDLHLQTYASIPEPRRRADLEPARLRRRADVLRRLDPQAGAEHQARPRPQPEGPVRLALQGQAVGRRSSTAASPRRPPPTTRSRGRAARLRRSASGRRGRRRRRGRSAPRGARSTARCSARCR